MQSYEDRVATTRGATPEPTAPARTTPARTTPEEEARRGESGTGTVRPGNFPEQNHGRWETDGEEVRTETRKNIGDRLTNLVDPEDDDPYDEARRGQGGSPSR